MIRAKELSEQQVNAILRASKNGVGVVTQLRRMNLPIFESLEWLKRHKQDEIRAAKVEQRRRG